jgi:DNA-binding CsgD family transcriptional regulator
MMRTQAFLLHSLKQARSADQLKLCVMDQAGDALGADMQALYLFEQPEILQPAEIYIRHISDSFVFEYEQLRRNGEPGYERIMRTRKAISDTTVYPGEKWKRSLLYRLNNKYRMKHYLCAPILLGVKAVGMLNLGRRSDSASFERSVGIRAEAVCRVISTRLAELSKESDGSMSGGESSIEQFGRLRADRAFLRSHLDQLEGQAMSLPPEEAAAFWNALALNRSTPVDFFDLNERRYVLLKPDELQHNTGRESSLTTREIEVMRRVAAGETNKAIGYDLGISMSTVASHLSSAIAKLGLRSRVRLIKETRYTGLVSKKRD